MQKALMISDPAVEFFDISNKKTTEVADQDLDTTEQRSSNQGFRVYESKPDWEL